VAAGHTDTAAVRPPGLPDAGQRRRGARPYDRGDGGDAGPV